MKPILEIKNISKKFHIGGDRGGYKTLRDSLFSKGTKKEDKGEFWALQDVSFDVFPGDTIGIIGKNGAGKSTLLKILSRITPPTKGKIICRGRIASLLEVGTGFHGELSGRENIYLNGSILGLKKAEINKKFDEIVDFSGVEKFLDTPLKHYSSGMQLRLAFAVAAHLEPEILIIDEVLAVGDAEFQKKCLGKMEAISKGEGRTILFVSHNLNAVESLCSKAILLKSGNLESPLLPTTQVIKKYLYVDENQQNVFWSNDRKEYSNEIFDLIDISLVDYKDNPIKFVCNNNEDFWFRVSFILKNNDPLFYFGYAMYTESGQLLYWSQSKDTKESSWSKLCLGENVLYSKIPQRLLNEGNYRIELIASIHFKKWLISPSTGPFLNFQIQGGLSDSPYFVAKRKGFLAPIYNWHENII